MKRYDISRSVNAIEEYPDCGDYVLFADHIAAIKQAEAELAALHAYIADLNTAQLKAEHEVRQDTLKECMEIIERTPYQRGETIADHEENILVRIRSLSNV